MKKLWIFFACLVFFSLASANAEAQESYYGDKVWTITFNMDVDPNTVNNTNIFIKDASGQTLNNVQVTLNPTTNQVYVDALNDYSPGTYTLHISDQVKSTSGNYLKTPTTKTFTIKSYEPITILKESQLNDAQKELLQNLKMHWWSQEWDWENRKNSRGAYYLGEDLYVVTTGIKSTGGYKIGINKIETNIDHTSVYLKDIELPPGIEGPAILDFPFIIIKSTVPPHALSFLIDEDAVPLKDFPLSNQ